MTQSLKILLCLAHLSQLTISQSDAGAYLSINSLAFTEESGQVVKRRLELNWYGRQPSVGDRILLEKGSEIVLELTPQEYPDGYFVSDIQLPFPTLEEMGFDATCVFDYRMRWVTSSPDGSETEVASACLQSQPTWMLDNRELFGKEKIGMLMIPGSHDAAAYHDYQGPGDDNLVSSAVFAQEEDLLHQLMWGVRFLDIRIGYYPTTEERFWLVHGIIKTFPLSEGLEQIKQFLRNTQEIFIWDINGFEQIWDDDAHMELQQLLLAELGEWWVLPGVNGWMVSLDEIWSQPGLAENQGRMIATYHNQHRDPNEYFPDFVERWGDVDEPEALRAYLEKEVGMAENNAEYQPWKPNCQMTPSAVDIVGGRWSGLREMADAVNRNVSRWWRDDWPDLPATFTISDYVLGTDMIGESIRRNKRIAAKANANKSRK